MYCVRKVLEDLWWVGGNDRRLAMFEGGTNSLAHGPQVCHSEERSDVGISQYRPERGKAIGEIVTAFPRLPRRPTASSQ